jgi:hypothetical protein
VTEEEPMHPDHLTCPTATDARYRSRTVPRADGLSPILRAVRERPDDERAWAALTCWLRHNGHEDEAEAVGAFWPAIADSLNLGMPLGRAMELLSRNAAGLAKLARRLGH